MTEFVTTVDTILLLGLSFSGIALSIVVSLRFLNFPDLTIEGSVPLGGAVGSLALMHTGSLALSLLAAIGSGLAAGCCTAFLHVKLGVGKLLSGILMLAILYSVNLRILGGSNISTLNVDSWWTRVEMLDRRWSVAAGVTIDPVKLVILTLLVGSLFAAGRMFFGSRAGIAIRSIGDNEQVLINLGRDPRPFKFLALALANAFAALAGVLVSLNQGFADVGMGQGVLVLGLAALIIGEQTIGRAIGARRLVLALLTAAIVGSIGYQLALIGALKLGIAPTDLKLFTALIVLISMVVTRGGSVFYEERSF